MKVRRKLGSCKLSKNLLFVEAVRDIVGLDLNLPDRASAGDP